VRESKGNLYLTMHIPMDYLMDWCLDFKAAPISATNQSMSVYDLIRPKTLS